MSRRQYFLWVVEMKMPRGRWEPTVGTSLSRHDGLVELKQWRKNCWSDTFRLRPYRRVQS
jgi:hypothetical protein